MADSREVTAELSRDLSLFHVTMMGLGMMIGAGVFVGIGLTVPKAGPGGLLLTFALNGIIALFTAMSFAELSSAIPRAGGVYNFARIGFGRGASFIAGWMEWLAASLAGAFYAVVFAKATVPFVAEAILGLQLDTVVEAAVVRVVALSAAGFFIYINYRGSSETGKVGAIFTVAQMLFVLAIGGVGVVVLLLNPHRLANFTPFLNQPGGWLRLLGTMGVIYVAFEGFEVIAQAGDETIDPKRNIPKAMLYSVLIVTVTYLLVAVASVVAIDGGDVREWFAAFINDPAKGGPVAGFRSSIGRLLPFGGLLVTLAIVASSTSALNATVYSATRASYALGRDRMLPAAFAKISPRRRTPYVALAFTGVIVLVAAGLLNEHHGAATASITFLCLFFIVNLCAIKIRANMSDELEYGYIMPLFPLLPVLAIVCQGALAWGILTESLVAWAIGAAWVVVGLVIFRFYSRTRVSLGEHEIQVLREEEAPPGAEYRIMVAVANPANALAMVLQTYRLCQARHARVELLHMVPVPDQVPLSDAERYMLEGREGILEAMLYLAPRFPISTHLRYCRSAARGIVSAVREKRIDMLIMGWHGHRRGRGFRLGSTIDPVVEQTPCDVVVFKNCGGDRAFRRVLVPLAGGPNGALALEIATILADPDDGEVTLFTVARRGQAFDVEQFLEQQGDRLRLPRERLRPKTVASRDVDRAILAEAEAHDLVVIGSTRQPLLSQFAYDPVPERIARLCDKPLVMVKAAGRLRGWVRRWL